MAANPNTISAGIQEVWDTEYQLTHYKIPVYRAFADFTLTGKLKRGDTIHREYITKKIANTMGADGSFIRQALTDTDESLTINKEQESSFYIKELDELQNNVPVRNKHARDCMAALFNQVDGDALSEIANATSSVDDGDLGGTSGNGITVTTTNIRKIFTQALKKLKLQNVLLRSADRFEGVIKEDRIKRYGVAVISPNFSTTLLESLDGKDTVLGDTVGVNGHIGRYMGWELFDSNALYWTSTLLVGTNPSNNDSVVINGVTFTFKTTLGTTAGNVLIGATAADSVDALVAAINDSENLSAANGGAGPSTVGTDYVELTLANRNLVKNLTATDGTTEMTMTSKGPGYIVVSETLTAAADIWTLAKQIEHQFFGINQSISVVIQKEPNMKVQPRSGFVGNDVVTWTVYGLKTFNDQKPMLVDVQTRSDAY